MLGEHRKNFVVLRLRYSFTMFSIISFIVEVAIPCVAYS